jgi:hypothetical protein
MLEKKFVKQKMFIETAHYGSGDVPSSLDCIVTNYFKQLCDGKESCAETKMSFWNFCDTTKRIIRPDRLYIKYKCLSESTGQAVAQTVSADEGKPIFLACSQN